MSLDLNGVIHFVRDPGSNRRAYLSCSEKGYVQKIEGVNTEIKKNVMFVVWLFVMATLVRSSEQ